MSKYSITLTEACDDKKFFMELVDGVPRLKKKTYYQCQGDSTGIKKIGFVVYYNETYIETIKLEEEK